MTQGERILEYIKKKGSITSLEANRELGIMQFGARLNRLRKEGHRFRSEWNIGTNKYGEKVKYKRYYICEGE